MQIINVDLWVGQCGPEEIGANDFADPLTMHQSDICGFKFNVCTAIAAVDLPVFMFLLI